MRRRTLLLSGAAGSGALLVGWGLLPERSRLGRYDTLPRIDGEIGLNGWIKIAADGQVLLAMHRSEMGQGVHTALAMLAAEELDVSLASVRLVPAGHDTLYGNVAMFVDGLPFHPVDREPGRETELVKTGHWIVGKVARELGINATGGSSSVADSWEVLRWAAATARAQLLGAASLRWRLPLADLAVKNGVVSHPSGPTAHYGELAKEAVATPSGTVKPKERSAWTLIGRAAPRIDLPAKTDGSAVFGIDVRQPGQLFAVVRHAPALGGSPGRIDAEAAMKQPGVMRVVRLGSYGGSTGAVAVVGQSTWHAMQGAKVLAVDWRAPPAGVPDSRAIVDALERTAREAALGQGGFTFHRRGDVQQAEQTAARRIDAVYRAPYLAHAALEPINCTAQVKDGRVDVWVPTQVPGMARAIAARVAGVDEEAVTVHVTYLGGGFGRRLEVDCIGQAVRIAIETAGRPVQLVWPREEDTTHDFYRPAGAAVMRASIDARGAVTGLTITSAGDAITPRWIERGLPALAGPVDLPDKTASEGLFDLPYGFPHQRIAHVATRHAVPVGFWRSVGHSHNAFFSECFIDELAHDANEDPLRFRLAWLDGMPRHAAVLKLAADKSGWHSPLPAGRARGLALHESFGSIVAEVVEVSLVGGRPKVHRVVVAADIGTVVNPAIVAQQMEGAVIFALSAALHGRIDIVGGVVQQTNFHDVAMVKLADSPLIETHLVPSRRPPSGVGEPGTPPLAPALANALFALTGRRLRELPLNA
ncbi:xanthine dehydrogenase family protein molybdopterin-binding subunit [Piscinibacter sp.]|uniref:xanthine dehydrogenase family protein molybdopterin-binding subunit n=1 Tax=Piscinibacter sp. TaxID=1903157 RepID=UPI002C319F58|nr:molybdopterin cofactor-binding domain-containing protein [Albitalea sp.]HUG24442.1 molybdopterin cofactor-binding domain-containing protein [Albitalea sp.]